MHYVLKQADFPKFVDSLKHHFPQSLQIYCQARNLMKNKCNWLGTEIVVDRYPDYSVCLSRPIAGSEAKNRYSMGSYGNTQMDYIRIPSRWYYQTVTLFAKDAESLESFLETDFSTFIDWYRPVCFLEIPSEYGPIIAKNAQRTGHTKYFEEEFKNDMVILKAADMKSFTPPSLPPEYQLGFLNESHLEQIVEQWNFGDQGGTPEDAYPMFRYLLTHDFPNVGVFTEKEELVAFALYGPTGDIYHGHVRKGHRHRGLFQIVNYHLVRKIADELGQEMTWVHVPSKNESLRRSWQKFGVTAHPIWKTNTLEYIVYLY